MSEHKDDRSISPTRRGKIWWLSLGALLVLSAVVLAVASGAFSSSGDPDKARPADERAVSHVACADAIGSQAHPSPGQRVVFGAIQLPPERLPGHTERMANTSALPYWAKSGVLLRASAPPVIVAVPRAWQPRAGIMWGGTTPVATVRFRTCVGSGWLAFAGGFRLQQRSACVPLHLRVGARRRQIRIGIGRGCP